MFLCLLVSSIGGMSFPVYKESNSTDLAEQLLANATEPVTNSSDTSIFKPLNLSKLLSPRKNDWRDEHAEKMIIWSLESQWHPDFRKGAKSFKRKDGKVVEGEEAERVKKSSKLMSFVILGSVIGFILYTYLSHVLMMRKLNQEAKSAQLRELLERSAMIMAGSVQQGHLAAGLGERRRSLINMFSHFKL